MLHLRSDSLATTSRRRRVLWPAWRAAAISSCSPARWAPARRRSPRASAGRSASTEPITSPTFTLVHSYQPAGSTLHHADIYRLDDTSRGRRPGASPNCRVRRHRARRMGRRRRRDVGRPPAGAPRVRRRRQPRLATIDDHARPGRAWAARWARDRASTGGDSHADPRHRDRDRAGQRRHRRPRGRARRCSRCAAAAATPRRSIPAIEFVCNQADIEMSEIGAIAVDVGPGLFTGMRVGLAAAKAHRPGAARADDRDQLARPAGVPAAPERPRRRGR